MLIDAHCHLTDTRFDPDRDAVLARAHEAGIGYFFQGGVGPEDWARQKRLGDPSWIRCFGLHPWWVSEHDDRDCTSALRRLEEALPDCSALGELGLDYFPRFPQSVFPRQRAVFQRQLDLARDSGMPIVLHVVRAHHEALPMLRSHAPWRGMVHAFTGSYEIAARYIEMGLLISVGGAVTRKGYRKLKDAVSRLPLDKIVIESDAPDMPPAQWPDKRNEPCAILETAAAVAEIKHVQAANVLAQSRANLIEAFDLELV